MFFILNEKESTEEEGTSEENIEGIVELKQLDIVEGSEIELKTIIGFSYKGTMKLKRVLKDKEVVVLIDHGATRNFIHQDLVEERQIPMENTPIGVTIGNGMRCKGKGLCKRVEHKLKELIIVVDFFIVELGSVDLVLGM